MDAEYILQPEDGLIKYGPEVIAFIRKEYNFDKKENREKAVAIIQEWIKAQDHFLKKDFSKGYIERTLITSKGSIEMAKKQIDKICTMKTLMPKYFEITNLRDSDIMLIFKMADIAILPQLTEEYYRVIIIKLKPNQVTTSSYEYTLLLRFLVLFAEYLKAYDCCRGYILIDDLFDTSASSILSKMNLIELQQCVTLLTEGYGCKIKGVLLVTGSSFIEGFIKILKPVFSEKIRSRIHAVTFRESLKDYVRGNILPEDYGGPEKSMKELHEDLVNSLSGEPVQKLLKEMNKAGTDESKRRIDKFNDQHMGMPGTFRTLSLD